MADTRQRQCPPHDDGRDRCARFVRGADAQPDCADCWQEHVRHVEHKLTRSRMNAIAVTAEGLSAAADAWNLAGDTQKAMRITMTANRFWKAAAKLKSKLGKEAQR